MEKNNTTATVLVYIVIVYAIFGAVQAVKAFQHKADAEQYILYQVCTTDRTFSSCSEKLDWLKDNEEDLEITIHLEEVVLYGDNDDK